MAQKSTSADGTSEKRTRSSRRPWVLSIVAVWCVLSLISASQRYADSLQTSRPGFFPEFLFWSLVLWSYWAFATPLIFRLGEKIPLSKQRLGFAMVAHFALSIIFGLSHLGCLAGLQWLVESNNTETPIAFFTGFARGVRAYLYLELILYWAITGAGIARSFHRKYRERELRSRELETQLNLARLQALKMQVQPHFLFNTLNTVAMLIRNGETSQAVEMVAGLGELLRSSLAGSWWIHSYSAFEC